MHIYITHPYKLDSSTTTGAAVRHVVAALDGLGLGHVPIGVYFQDAPGHRRSVCERAVAAYPELGALVVGNQVRPALSNLGSQWCDDNPLDDAEARTVRLGRETLFAIADGVPQRFPFFVSHFIFGPVPSLELIATPSRKELSLYRAAEALAPLIVVESKWKSTRREIRLHATVVTATPPLGAKSLPALPADTAQLIAAIGKPSRAHQTLEGSDEERAALDACYARADAIAEEFKARIDPASLPRTLGRSAGYVDQHGSLKNAVAPRLKPLGYRHTSPGGSIKGLQRLTRRTKLGNVSIIDLDRTPIGAEFRVCFTLSGPLWNIRAYWLPVSRDPAALQIHTDEECQAAAENLEVLVRRWEEEVVPAVEAIYGPGASWYVPEP